MPLPDPIEKPLIEELESLIPGIAPTKHSILPEIKTNKTLLYSTPGSSENSEQLNLIETASQAKDELSRTEADAFIIKKASDINSLPSASTSALTTNSTLKDIKNSEVDLLIGKIDSDLEDPLINPNLTVSNNPNSYFNKPATNTQATNTSSDNSELNKTPAATTDASDELSENTAQLPDAAVAQSDQENIQKFPAVTADTAREKAASQTTVVPTAETISKPEENQTPSSSETTLKSESEPNKTSPATASTADKSESNKTSPTENTTANNLETATNLEPDKASTPSTSNNFDSNAFTVDEKGTIGIEFTSDGGLYAGQLAIVNLKGMERFVPGSEEFILEAASRALSNSTNGYIAISDDLEGAYYTNPNSSENFNSGPYLGKKTFAMTPGDKFFFMLVPNGTVQEVYDNPAIGGDKKPLFSIATENPNDGFSIGQIADITGSGQLFVMEDMAPRQESYRDYDDITFRVTGAKSQIVSLSQLAGSSFASIHSELIQKLKGESDKSEPLFTGESTVTNSADKSPEETPSITADNDQQEPQPTVANSESQESLPTETSTVANSDSQQSPARETLIVDKSDTQESPVTETSTVDKSDTQELPLIEQTASPPETLSVSPTELNSEIAQPVEIGTENAANLIEDNTAFPEIAAFLETEQLVTKTELILATPEAHDTVEPELTVAEITAKFESKQLPPKTDALPLSEDSADTINTDTAVTFTAAELETENPPAIVVNSLELEPLTSYSDSSWSTDSVIPTLFSNSSETAAGTAQIASVETSVSPSTLNSPPEPTSNTNNSNSTPTETTGYLPTYSENEIAPKPADISSGLVSKEAEESAQMSDGIADIVSNPTQRAGDFQSNTNSQANRSIRAAANSLIPGTFLVENADGQVKFDYQFDGGYYEGELGIFSLSGMETLTPGSPEFIAEAARRVLTNSTEGHIVIRDSIEGAKFTGAMPPEGEWGSGEYQGIKTFNMTPGDTFAVMVVPSGTVQSSLQFSWLWDLFPEHRPLFSIADANPDNTSYVLPIADATGTGNTFVMEDMSAASSDGDYNDLIFTVIGAKGNAPLLSTVINPAKEWRNTPLGQELIEYANSLVEPTEPNDTIVLVEGEIFVNQYSQTLTVPASGSILNISLSEINFDTNDPKSINDALEIALVDNLGKSLVPTISPGKNAFFNSTEGQQSQLAPGVTFNGTTISVNLSQIAPGTAAELQVRLVNNDRDTATRVGITSIGIQPSETTTAPITVSPDEGASTNAPVNFASLRDVSSSLEAEYKQTSFNEGFNILYADLAVKNTGQYPVRGTLLVGINNISDPTVRLLDADGITPEGMPYYDITKLVGGGILEPGELTSTDTLKFDNPEKVQFSYDLVFLSQLNQVPEFKTAPDAEALVGKGYVYSAIAVDADGDALTYSLLEKPQGMEIDAQTGIISWNPVAGDMGNHAVTVEASDGKGGVARQKYVLSAINPPPNRPPIFTSTPVVDAAVNVPYTYEAIAKDPDSNPLTYTLVSSPAGMSVNPSTGQLTWTPTSDQLGLSEVVLKVTDGQGGTTEQAFKIQSQKEPGNHAPIITSEPETKAYASKGYTYQLSSVDPDLDPLEYSLVAAPQGMKLDHNTGQITWNNLTSSDVGQHEVTVKVKDNRGAVDTQTYTLNVSNVVPGELKGKVYLDDRQPLDALVYFNDFEEPNRSIAEWSNPITDVTPIGNRNFLGQYSSISKNNPRGKTSLELNSLPEHDTVTVSFDLYILKSWDGLVNPIAEPALWELNVENGPTLLQTTFSNVDGYWYSGAGQSYPDTYSPTTNNNPPRTGATETNTLGYGFYGDSTYKLSFTFDHKDSSLLLNFLGNAGNSGVTDIENESWGLDNVEVRVGSKSQGLSNWPVYLDSNGNNKRDLSEQFTLTDEQGNYSFTLEPGNYTVAQELQTGWTQVVPTGNTYQVALAGNQTVKNLDFGNTNATLSNVPPSFLSQPPNDAMVGQKFRYRAVATDKNGDVLSYDLTVKPDGMVVDAKTGLVSWLPTPDQIGIQNAVLRVTDGNGGVDLQSFQTTVSPPNTLPIFLTGPGLGLPLNPTAVVGQTWKYEARASDADNDPLAFSLAGAPEGVKVDSATGLVTWTPKTEQAGNHSITVTASDGRGQPIAQTFNIEVAASATNSDPIITSAPRLKTGLGRPYFYNVQALDANSDPLTYTLATAPVGMTIDEKGRIFWQPNSAQFGSNPVKIVVSDGRSGVAEQEFAIDVSSYSVNQPPSIESEPFEVAIAQQPYQYNPIATDPDGDPLFWSLDAAPVGMSIDPETGKLRWQPSLEQVGSHEVAVRVMDSSGTYVGQAFTLNVRGVNVSPGIISTPPTLAAANKAYNYQVLARDTENDPLTFSLVSPPNGMTIDPETGLIQWTPSESQVGVQNVAVLVSDSSGGTASQQYTLAISETAINLPPAITSTPVFTASPGRPYTYQVTAADADGTISQYQLLQAPTGMTINSANGAITWNNPAAGNHQIVVGAVDNSGAGAAQGFELIARANSTPNVPTIPIQSVSPGGSYRYDLKATDANGDLLTFALIQSPSGMTVDEFGRISWKPSAANIGTHPVEVKVTDTFGESVTVSYNLSVVADTVAPKVSLIASNNTVGVGDSVTFTVNAVDNVKVESLGLTVNGTPVVLDAQGQANVKVNNLGSITAVATALDAAGNAGTATQAVAAIDTSDVSAPTINISLEDDAEISAPVNITGTINDSNLAYYTLEVAPVGGGEFKEVYRGTTAVNNGTVATFDPTVLANGAYTLKFTAFDANGNGSTTERTVNVAGDLKLGNFRLSFTDLTVPVAGIPISVTRTYDSLNANSTDDFGYGWRMEFRDTDLKTSLKADPTYEELGINTVPFDSKTKVFITLPGGKRETFTFKPTPHHLNQYLGAAGPGAAMYKPAFESQKGSTMTLTVKDANLVRNEYGEYYGVNGQPFNPENPAFGSIYVLTTKEGLVYEIDAASGDLLTATEANGNKLTFSDAGIVSSTGKSVTFERDVAGRIVSVVDPDGKKVKYEYDAKGDLVAVKDREENRTQFKYEDEDRPHFLTEVIDPLGRSGVKTEYDDSGRLKQVINGADVPINIEYKPEESVQVVKDVYGNPTIYKYDTRGNVLQVANAYGNSTYFEYDDNNNVTQARDANNLVTKYEYDSQNNLISRTETYCGCPGVVPGTSRYTYNGYGQMTSLVMPTGASVLFNYDPRGNLLSIKDGQGNVIQSFTYYANGLVKTETEGASTTYYEYDDYGNVLKSVESDGSATYRTYDGNGRLKTMVQDRGTPADATDDETFTFTYDKLGREKRVDYGNGIWVEYGYTGSGSDWTSLDAPTIGHIERKLTDDGKLAGWVRPDGGTPSFYYDLAGRLWKETDEAGNITTEYEYDAAGRLTSIKDVQTGAKTIKKYDAGGRLIEEIDPLGSFVKTAYDPRSGKLTSTRRGKYLTDTANKLILDATDNPIPDPAVRPQTWNYEYNGTRTTVIDPLGRKTTSVQDANYLPVETIYQQRNGSNYSEKVKYLYANNLQEAKDYPTEITDIGGNDRDFTYDRFGLLKTATDLGSNIYTYTYGEDGLALIESPNSVTSSGTIKERLRYEYDDLGNLAKVIYGDGTVKKLIYHAEDNRLATVILPSGETINYEYDSAGRVESETTKSAAGLVTSIVTYTYGNGGNVKTVTSDNDTTTYHYDSLTGALSGIDYPDGSGIAYTYDLLGRVKGQTEWASASGARYVTSYGYDAFGNLATVTDPVGGVTKMVYDDANRLKQRILPDGKVTTTYEYDGLDRVKSIVHKNDRGEVLASVSYERIGIGEPTKITREDSSYVLLEYDESLRVKKESYYDASGVLQDETTYTYDAAGKRLVQSSSVKGDRAFNYQAGYQLDTVSEVGETENYDYDANGRLTLIERDGETLSLRHDTGDRLTEVENQTNGETIQYVYDGQGNRVKAVEGSQERRFLVTPAGGSGLESTDLMADASGNLITNYIYSGGSSPFMRLDASGNPVYYLTDAMGTVIGLADGTGQEVGDFRYDSFGNLRNASGVAANAAMTGGDFRFQGQWLESESGLYYFRARDYDPKTGLFLSRDPVDIIEREPESFNPYQFVYNNPYVYSDPTGMFTLVELNSVMTTGDILSSMKTYAGTRAKEEIAARANQIAADAFFDIIGHFLPLEGNASTLTSLVTDAMDIVNKAYGGTVFERFFKGLLCLTFPQTISNFIFFEPLVAPGSGRARDGYQCPQTTFLDTPLTGTKRPDFIISPVSPNLTQRGGPRSWLVGDIKVSLKTVGTDYLGWPTGKSPDNPRQWEAITNHAKNYGALITGFVTLFDGGKDRDKLLNKLQQESLEKGVATLVASILIKDTTPSSARYK